MMIKGTYMHKIFQLLLCIIVLGLAGCKGLWLYQPSVQQGNVFEPKQISQIKLGMSKGEVRFILGTSLLQNAFEEDRWDYVYTLNKQGKIVETKRLTLIFSNDRLRKIVQA